MYKSLFRVKENAKNARARTRTGVPLATETANSNSSELIKSYGIRCHILMYKKKTLTNNFHYNPPVIQYLLAE